jgi:hypothetical protein
LLQSTTNSQLDIKLGEFATVLDYGRIQNYCKQPNAEVDTLAKEKERERERERQTERQRQRERETETETHTHTHTHHAS